MAILPRGSVSVTRLPMCCFCATCGLRPPGPDLQFQGKRVAEEGSTHHPSAAIADGNVLRFWYTENAGQGKGYRISAGKLVFDWPDE